jgi:RNA polymerase sigma factor (sigma-70 family)
MALQLPDRAFGLFPEASGIRFAHGSGMTAIELDRTEARDACATRLMERFRRTGSREVFDALVSLTRDQLLHRVRARTRYLVALDPHEVLQDAYINIYCYPDRFDAARPGAFRAWSAAIVDNAVRRHLRVSRNRVQVQTRPIEVLAQEPDHPARQPDTEAIAAETREEVGRAFRILLGFYLAAYHALTARERFVLQMVEVEGKRYADVASVLKTRPEALKMVVFRARRRIFERLRGMFPVRYRRPTAPAD